MRGIIFKTVKEGFRRLHKQHKSEVARQKRSPSTAPPVIPMSLKKADFKRKIRGTKFTGQAEFKSQPGLKRRLIVGIEKGRRTKKKLRKPIIYGKAFASDKKGRTMQIQPLTRNQRKQMKKEMAKSADKEYKRVRLRKFGYNTGGMKTIKTIKSKLEKASAAHAGQAKALGKVIDKKKLLLGGLLTAGIKASARKLFKSGTRKTQQIVKESGGTRAGAKSDVKSAIADDLKAKLRSSKLIKSKRRMIIRDINKLRR